MLNCWLTTDTDLIYSNRILAFTYLQNNNTLLLHRGMGMGGSKMGGAGGGMGMKGG
jgi:hypothetical protein